MSPRGRKSLLALERQRKRAAAAPPEAASELYPGLLFAELSPDEFGAMADAHVRRTLGHPPVDAPGPPPPEAASRKAKAKTLVRVDRPKKKG